MDSYDNWLMTDPWNRPQSPPSVWEIWNDDVTEEQMFEYATEDGEFQSYLVECEVVPEEVADDPDKVDGVVHNLWADGSKELLHYLEEWYKADDDRVERLVHRYWGYLYE